MTTTSSRHLAYRSGRGTNERYTPAEDARIVAQWSRGPLRALVPVLNRSESSIVVYVRKLVARGVLKRSAQFYHPRWTAAQDDVIRDGWGVRTDAWVARQCGRTVNAVRERACKLGIQRKDQALSMTDVAHILHVDEHRVRFLEARGWLTLTTTRWGAAGRTWRRCSEASLRRFLRHHPAQYDPRRITDEPWRSVARAAHTRAAFLGTSMVAARLNITPDAVVRACRTGRLQAEKSTLHGGTGTFLIRAADLAAYRPRGKRALVGVDAVRDTPQRAPLRFPKQVERRLRVRFQPVDWRAS